MIDFSKHFFIKWEERKSSFLAHGIDIESIIEFVKNPDFILEDDLFPNRRWCIKRIGGRCLKIVVEDKGDKLIIITAYFDRTLRRKGLCG